MTEQEERAMRLSEVLVKRGIISDAQMELAMADREINDLPLEEVLLARGWIREDVLYDAAPWLRGSGASTKPSGGKTGKTGAHPKPSTSSNQNNQPPAEKPAPAKADIKAQQAGPAGTNVSPLQSDYNENRRAYKDLLHNIIGKELAD
ncbi:MAG: hypothetical protein K2W95_33390 [Candidatus Obscuribacterales bacterium]|nr:hypothetical protein [Candidatus Obscuribacterales bacterium]